MTERKLFYEAPYSEEFEVRMSLSFMSGITGDKKDYENEDEVWNQ